MECYRTELFVAWECCTGQGMSINALQRAKTPELNAIDTFIATQKRIIYRPVPNKSSRPTPLAGWSECRFAGPTSSYCHIIRAPPAPLPQRPALAFGFPALGLCSPSHDHPVDYTAGMSPTRL